MTATIVDIDRHHQQQKPRVHGAGRGQYCQRFLGGMAGCAMIGQSVINVKSGGRGRLSR